MRKITRTAGTEIRTNDLKSASLPEWIILDNVYKEMLNFTSVMQHLSS